MWQQRRSGAEQLRSSNDHRTPYERDRTRLIHASAFRRLQRKTQVFGTLEGDFHRTRLTHSLEVDSIARSLVRNLRYSLGKQSLDASRFLPDEDLITAIALSHDIGHPPFGHGGETVLNYMMRDHGGFEANGQTLRLLTKLESSYAPFGLDLTRRTLLGILKYPVPYSQLNAALTGSLNHPVKINAWVPPKGYLDTEQVEADWVLLPLEPEDKARFQTHIAGKKAGSHRKALYRSLDSSIMDIADDIAYGVHDLEDAIHLGMIHYEQAASEQLKHLFDQAFPNNAMQIANSQDLLERLFYRSANERKQAISALVNGFITSAAVMTVHESFKEPLLRYNAILPENTALLLEYFKEIVFEHIINSHEARTLEHGGQMIIQHLFEAVSSNPEQLLSLPYRRSYENAANSNEGMRVVCDYIASMTDEYAYRLHERLFGFRFSR